MAGGREGVLGRDPIVLDAYPKDSHTHVQRIDGHEACSSEY